MRSKIFGTRSSLFRVLSQWYALSAFGLVSLSTGYLYWSLVRTLEFQDSHLLSDRAQAIRMLVSELPGSLTALRTRVEEEWHARKFELIYVRVTDGSGRKVTQTPSLPPEVRQAFDSPTDTWRSAPATDNKARVEPSMMVQAFSVPITNGVKSGEKYYVQLFLDRSAEETISRRYRTHLYLVLVLAVLVAVFFGSRIASHAVNPIHQITLAARRIRSSTLHERIPSRGMHIELLNLADTFNAMLDRLEDSFTRLSQFSADIAHELRTPLSNLAGELQVALGKHREEAFYRDTLGSALEECDRLSRITDSLLFLARAEDPKHQITKERVRLRAELQTVMDFYGAAAMESGIGFTLDSSEIEIEIERTLFQRAIGNVVSNALKHTQRGGTLRMVARREGAFALIELTDTGRGIPEDRIPYLFDRFYRVDESRSTASGGTGLGLAIVKSIAHIHGGSVELTSRPGEGTIVRLRFPAIPA